MKFKNYDSVMIAYKEKNKRQGNHKNILKPCSNASCLLRTEIFLFHFDQETRQSYSDILHNITLLSFLHL